MSYQLCPKIWGYFYTPSFYQHIRISTSPCHFLVFTFIIIPEAAAAEETGCLLFILKQVASLL